MSSNPGAYLFASGSLVGMTTSSHTHTYPSGTTTPQWVMTGGVSNVPVGPVPLLLPYDAERLSTVGVCHGCGHSAADSAFPGRPSGESPCRSCVRNPDAAPGDDGVYRWYGSELGGQLDMYRSVDMQVQVMLDAEERRRSAVAADPSVVEAEEELVSAWRRRWEEGR